MHMDVALQVLRPGVQDQAEGGFAVLLSHPFGIGGEFRQGLRGAGEQGVDDPARMRAVQGIQVVGQGEHQVGVGHGQDLGQPALQPGVLGARAALRAVAVAARVVLPVAVAAGLAGQLLAAQGCRAASHDGPPGFGLGRGQGVMRQVRGAVAAQHLSHAMGQRGHAASGDEPGDRLQARQAGQQVQRVGVLGRAELRADQVQVAAGGADVAVAQQAADGVQVHAAFEQVRGEAVAQGVGAAALGDAGAVPGCLVGALQALDADAAFTRAVGEQPFAWVALRRVGLTVQAQQRQQAGAQDAVAVGAALAGVHAHAHAVWRAVDVAHAQAADFRDAQARGVEGLQRHPVHGM